MDLVPALEESAPNAGQVRSDTPTSLPGSKRPRDYGEQLKGLSSSDDEGVQHTTALPASKKQKTTHPDNGSDSGLDDGEIVESTPGPGPALPGSAHDQSTSQAAENAEAVAGPSKPPAPGVITHEPSEDGEINSPMADPEEANVPDAPFFIDKSGSRPVQHSGWNQGLTLGARTSFGKPATQLFPAGTPADPEPKDGDENEKSGNSKGQSDTLFAAGKTIWVFPQMKIRITEGGLTPEFWIETLKNWIIALLQANPTESRRLSTKVVRAGFGVHLTSKKLKLLQGTKKEVNAAKSAAQEAMANADIEALVSEGRKRFQAKKPQAENVGATEENAAVTIESSHEGSAKEDAALPVPARDVSDEEMDSDVELYLLQKYFPGPKDPSRFCISCSGTGHRIRECPQRTCKFCGSRQHSMYGCPTVQRCSKCHQLGHSGLTCNEVPVPLSEVQIRCAFCSAEHTEDQCSQIWRTFTLTEEVHKKVRDIPAFCYTCGAKGHYGPECELPDRGGKVTGFTTWSQANRLRYIDPNSQEIALALVNVKPAQPERGNFHIRGMAKRQVHTHFVSSDESEDEFIHERVKKQEPRGEIRIASNISSIGQGGSRGRPRRNNDQSRRRQNQRDFSPPPAPPPGLQGGGWQPPLPPGPPPPLTRSGFRGSLPSAPPASLPPRPQSFNQGANRGGTNNRGSRGGRGGGRGRGRGRGK
ncbi:hypothetical protein F4677DRAFT_433631 [Hypoxylon crocopeplum]|nr:hypothetical protein F4677DRAFT_433631 [Hypoxylon crocopeplum]